MIKITFPDGNIREYQKNITAFEIAESISKSLSKKTIIALINGAEKDLYFPIEKDSSLELITKDDQRSLEVIRHDTAHLMAQAVQELYDGVQVTIGPSIEDGFYYDFACETPFTLEDLPKIEKRMRQLAEKNIPIQREVWKRADAIKHFENIGEKYKAEIIQDLPDTEEITCYRQGDFMDLCRGPHARNTSFIKHFKLTKISGAYWRGDAKNQMLQRIYGTSWNSKEELEAYLTKIEEAEKRDHRKLGKELNLFHIQEEAAGSIFWHENGTIIYNLVQDLMTKIWNENGYFQVKTPQLIDKTLWEKSGHWAKFRENMFIAESENRELAVKPMNCPAHVQIFNSKITSYRDLPLRMAEFGCCHRNESSGSLHGLMRVRSFVQDDAHIFCEESQIESETKIFTDLVLDTYKIFGFDKVRIKFSDRPENRAGSDEVWDRAEGALRNAIEAIKIPYEMNPGEGAFYGPKLEFVLTDAIGRDWQLGTLQVDFVLPERLDAKYTAQGGKIQRPVMLHRAIFGSFERFIGILIEHYAGKFPFWLTPKQVVITTVTNAVDEYADNLYNSLKSLGVRVMIDKSPDKISYKIRKYSLEKIPYIFILGEKERNEETVQIRELGSREQISLALSEINNKIEENFNPFKTK